MTVFREKTNQRTQERASSEARDRIISESVVNENPAVRLMTLFREKTNQRTNRMRSDLQRGAGSYHPRALCQ
ncbi:MAG: hypothetical protein CMF59_02470 [Leptospiraceae bacterium]|nr:hypothetical protein [Leptospiraceae bacterium]